MGSGSILDGMLAGIEAGYFQQEIANAAFQYQQLLEKQKKVIVGVNRFTSSVQAPPEVLTIGPETEERQTRSVGEVRANRDRDRADKAIEALRKMAHDESVNSIPVLIEAAKAHVTLGEMVETLKAEWGIYTEPPMF
jgi:methylmalonyl-CoA mutase N-terminal domain/subunit